MFDLRQVFNITLYTPGQGMYKARRTVWKLFCAASTDVWRPMYIHINYGKQRKTGILLRDRLTGRHTSRQLQLATVHCQVKAKNSGNDCHGENHPSEHSHPLIEFSLMR